MIGDTVVRSVAEMRPRVEQFLEPGEQFQVWVGASWRRSQAVKLMVDTVFPFVPESAKVVLVATDRRWLVLQSAKERYRGALTEVSAFPRDIRLKSSWVTQFKGFGDVALSIDPFFQLSVVVANDALDAMTEGRPWSLEESAGSLTEADQDSLLRRAEPVLMPVSKKLGRILPPRPKFLRK